MKRIRLLFSITCLIAFLASLPSCSLPSGPLVANDGSVAEAKPANSLVQRGIKEFTLIKKQKKISRNTSYNTQLQRVASRLKRVVDMPSARWEFVVFEDPTPNAFALPGGKVGVHTGLFPITQSDAGLATVIGHEIAHITRDHAGIRRKQAIGLGAVGIILDQVARSKGASSADRVKLGALYGTGATLGVALPHSRKAEIEADKLGAIYMAKAGYNPNEAVSMWERFAAYKNTKGRRQPEFLSTHPIDSTRINTLKQFMPIAMREYRR